MKKILHRITDWAHWPFALFHFPLFFLWGWYCLKSRAAWFFSAANPTISFGGFEGESKSEIYAQMPPHFYPATLLVQPHICEQKLIEQVEKMFSFPFVVKPDVGMQGILFRKVENVAQLLRYHRQMHVPYLVQAYVPYEVEVSIFYCRLPAQSSGVITAFIQKILPAITGDGVHTTAELLLQNEKYASLYPALKRQLGKQLERVVPAGEELLLSNIGNRANGAVFTNLKQHISSNLVRLFDDISASGQFCYGRYDIKCQSIEDFEKGRNFLILEFNGAGSIPNHIYTPGVTLWQAWGEVARHWHWLYRISRQQHKAGVPYWRFKKGVQFLQEAKRHFKHLKQVDSELVLE